MNTSDIRDRRRRNAKRGVALGALSGALPLALTACFPLPGLGGGSADSSVGFDDVQKAVIQIESVGTFVSPEEGGYEAAGRGSGFIIDEGGIAITNNHVVVGAGTLKVWRGGDTSDTLNAKVLGSSECLDLAVIDLQGDGYPSLGWHEGEIPTAMDVYAAGFPLGDPEFTMTRGIVSKADTPTDTPWASLDHVIEHDAKIRSGNSGGPLVDGKGRIVGVNYAGSDQYDTNLAIHRDEVEEAIESLKKGEDVLSLGINGTGLTDEEGNGLGIWVNSVASGSTADKAGVKPGDLLTRMEGVSIGIDGTMADYCDVLRTHGQDATLSVELYRPSEDVYYDGQFNGDAVEAVSVLSQTDPNAGTQSGGGSSSAADVEYTELTDDSGGLLVEAPAAWNQVDGSAMTDGKGNQYKRIDASPDLAGFNAGWDVPGVSVIASDTAATNTTPQEWLDLVAAAAQQGGCELATHDVFEDGYHTGLFDYYTGCGNNDADYLMVAAVANDGSYLTALAVQALTEQDLDAIDHAVGSFIAQF